MTEPVNRSHQPLRSETWKDILEIVDGFRELKVDCKTQPLKVNSDIRPNLPTPQQAIADLSARSQRPLPSSLAAGLCSRINLLRERVLSNYTASISQMASTTGFKGLSDSDFQRNHCRSFEIWFDQAIEELFAVFAKHSAADFHVSPFSHPHQPGR